MNITRRLLATAAACLIGLQAHAAELPTSTAEDVGMAGPDRRVLPGRNRRQVLISTPHRRVCGGADFLSER